MPKQVKSPLVIVRNDEGADVYLYRGAAVPSFVKGDQLKQLVDGDMVGDVDEPAPGTAAADPGPSRTKS